MAETGRETVNSGADGTTETAASINRSENDKAARIDAHAGTIDDPVTLAESLVSEAGWQPLHFGNAGPNPPYIRIGGKLWVSMTEFEPCFSSVWRDRWLLRTKISMLDHLGRYDQMMVEPAAFDDVFGAGEGTEATFPFGAWLSIRRVTFGGIELWGKRQGDVVLPLEALAVASAIWLRKGVPAGPRNVDE